MSLLERCSAAMHKCSIPCMLLPEVLLRPHNHRHITATTPCRLISQTGTVSPEQQQQELFGAPPAPLQQEGGTSAPVQPESTGGEHKDKEQ